MASALAFPKDAALVGQSPALKKELEGRFRLIPTELKAL
jgi:hypothetical protein